MNQIVGKPFLRWAGGKTKIVHLLKHFVPPRDNYERYIEPFVGGGALFFALGPERAILGDLNEELINCYQQVALYPSEIWKLLLGHMRKHSKGYYYKLRENNLSEGTKLERAARFIYINKTAFNGIFRVNRQGIFNVPFGPSSSGPAIPSKEELLRASELLKSARLIVGDFVETCSLAKKGDFVYLDPPYPPSTDTSNFTHYTSERFGWQDHEKVAGAFKLLDHKGCLVMMSNSDQERIRDLFRGFNIKRLSVTRWLGSNGDRFKVHELVITNYDMPDS